MSRKVLLDAVAAYVIVCKKCSLWKTRKNAVSGEGNARAKIVFIGEAPGRTEDMKGRPFVGAAGKFLETLLAVMGLSREDVFICNVLKCRPPGNRAPKPCEIKTCTPYLDKQVEIIKPKVVVTLGSFSTAYVFQKANLPFTSITQVHGKPCKANILNRKVTIFPTFHPAAALYNARFKERLTKDFQYLKIVLRKSEYASH